MISRLGIALGILVVVVLGAAIIFWTVETPSELDNRTQAPLNHKLQLKPPPDYTIDTDTVDSSAYACDKGVDVCMVVYTEGDYDAKELASITRSILSDQYYASRATSIQFADGMNMASTGMSYCFASKDHLFRTLGKISLDEAQLLGTIDSSSGENHCYIVVHEGDAAPDL